MPRFTGWRLALLVVPAVAGATEPLPPGFLDWLATEARVQAGFEGGEEGEKGTARSPSQEDFGAWLTWWQSEPGEEEMEEAEQ